MTPATRRTLTAVHRWIGLTLGLVVLLSAMTGAGMAFRKQLDPLLYPSNFKAVGCARGLPLDSLVERAIAAHPGRDVDYVRLRAGLPVIVRFTDKQSLFLDRCSGAVTGSQNRYAGLFGWLEFIHRGQWLAQGGWLMGAGALAVILGLAGMGLWLWWPQGKRRMRDALKLERRLKGPAFLLGLHRTVGAWGALLLLASAVTALPNAFDSIKIAMVGNEAKPPKGQQLASVTAPSLAAQWATVQRLTPDPHDALIHVARKSPTNPIEVFTIERGAPHPNARSYIYLDSTSGAVLRFAPYAGTRPGSKAYFWMLSYHTGEAFGLIGQLAIFLAALVALVLGYTGIDSWLSRKLRQRRARRDRATAPA